jgi:hypothetical protein
MATINFQRSWVSLLSGTVFGFGLALAQMTDPNKVLGFLDVAGDWDPSLMLVLGDAVGTAALAFRHVLRRAAPALDNHFHISHKVQIDAPLLVGATLFGVGWGLGGYCPGPAISSLGFGNAEALWFVPAMLLGAGLQRWQARLAVRRTTASANASA